MSTTIYRVAEPNKTIVALFTHGKVNIKLLEMYTAMTNLPSSDLEVIIC